MSRTSARPVDVTTLRRIHVSKISDISEALITHTAIRGFVITKQADRLVALAGRCWDARGIGNSMSHLAVARGTADIGWTSRANLWDFAALALIVTEAELEEAVQVTAVSGFEVAAQTHQLAHVGQPPRSAGHREHRQVVAAALQRTIDLYDVEIDAFRAYKDRLIDYLERFIKDLTGIGGEIAELLGIRRGTVGSTISHFSASDVVGSVLK